MVMATLGQTIQHYNELATYGYTATTQVITLSIGPRTHMVPTCPVLCRQFRAVTADRTPATYMVGISTGSVTAADIQNQYTKP